MLPRILTCDCYHLADLFWRLVSRLEIRLQRPGGPELPLDPPLIRMTEPVVDHNSRPPLSLLTLGLSCRTDLSMLTSNASGHPESILDMTLIRNQCAFYIDALPRYYHLSWLHSSALPVPCISAIATFVWDNQAIGKYVLVALY